MCVCVYVIDFPLCNLHAAPFSRPTPRPWLMFHTYSGRHGQEVAEGTATSHRWQVEDEGTGGQGGPEDLALAAHQKPLLNVWLSFLRVCGDRTTPGGRSPAGEGGSCHHTTRIKTDIDIYIFSCWLFPPAPRVTAAAQPSRPPPRTRRGVARAESLPQATPVDRCAFQHLGGGTGTVPPGSGRC